MNSLQFQTIKETTDYLNNNLDKGYVLLVPTSMIDELSKKVGENVVLCSTSGGNTQNGSMNGIIKGFDYDRLDGEIVEIENPPIKSVDKLSKAYAKVKKNSNAFMLLLCNGVAGMDETIMSTLSFMDKEFKLIGESSGDTLQLTKPILHIGSKKVFSVGIYFDMKSRIGIFRDNSYVPIGEKLHIVETNPINQIIKAISSKPVNTDYDDLWGYLL